MDAVLGVLRCDGAARRPGDIAFRVCVLTCFIQIILITCGLIAFIAGYGGSSSELEAALKSSPVVFNAFMGLSFFVGIVLNGYGLVQLVKEDKRGGRYYFVLTGLYLLFICGVFLFVLFRGNGVLASSPTQAKDTATKPVETRFLQWAQSNRFEWDSFQTENSCCGFNFAATYEDYYGIDVAVINSGGLFGNCGGSGQAAVGAIQAEFPTYNETAQERADADFILGSPNYFCYTQILENFRDLSRAAGIYFGFQVLFEFIIGLCLGLLLFSMRSNEGGFKKNPPPGPTPTEELTALGQAGYTGNPKPRV